MKIQYLILIMSLFFFSCGEESRLISESMSEEVGGGSSDNDGDNDSDNDGDCDESEGNICGCLDSDAINFNPNATVDNGTCQYYTGELNVVWSKTIEEAGEMWSMRPVSDGGFIMACGGAGDCENGTYDDPCEYYGQLVRLDVDGNVICHKTY